MLAGHAPLGSTLHVCTDRATNGVQPGDSAFPRCDREVPSRSGERRSRRWSRATLRGGRPDREEGADSVIRTRLVMILTLSHHKWCKRIPFPARSRRLSDRPSWWIFFVHGLARGHGVHGHRRPSQLTPMGSHWSRSTASCDSGDQRRVVSKGPNHFGSDRASSRSRRPAPPGGIGHNGHRIRQAGQTGLAGWFRSANALDPGSANTRVRHGLCTSGR